ncbi:acid-resistance protein [Providencia rettgeri]|uniref:Acid stress chaperone HdeA n=1 Tax=Providencia rettgeri TaxID=587 RepID=A0A379FT77_PRORE|nr:acid-activated periplasmic chaperone HdeA [Providencia rettgeri]QXB04735.1 acid-resistance protein [Providencia rettgeri]SUC32024.1 10K-S protein [Providencia rettgeri]
MKKTLFTSIIVMSLMSASAFAATNAKPVSQWTCEDFLAIDDAFYPTAIGAAEIITQKGKVEDPTLDISGIETSTPLIVEACEKAPKESFIQKVEAHLKKM